MNFSFEDFLSYFPEAELPVNISSEYMNIFGKINTPVPEDMINEFILNGKPRIYGPEEIENEYIACFLLPDTREFKAIVYINISLLNYEYFLHTFDNAGRTISCIAIASLNSDGKQITEKTAMIDDKYQIWTMEGSSGNDHEFDPSESLFVKLYITANGEILEK